jgi:hypothetical protein
VGLPADDAELIRAAADRAIVVQDRGIGRHGDADALGHAGEGGKL